MPQTQVRVVGSGFTTFNYNGAPIAFLEEFADRGRTPLGSPSGPSGGGPGYEFIHPLGDKYPREIATSRALAGGELVLTIRELWNAPVWQQLRGIANARNIIDVWEALAVAGGTVTCQMIIRPPGNSRVRTKTYFGCTIVNIDDTETVAIGTLSVAKNITVAYTHADRA